MSSIIGISSPSLARSLAVYGTCFVAMIAAVLAGLRFDRRLPRGFRT